MNAHAAHTVDDVPRRLLSVTELSRMIEAGIIGDEENVELIDGELIVTAAKKARHELMKSAVLRRLVRSTADDIYVGVEVSLRHAGTRHPGVPPRGPRSVRRGLPHDRGAFGASRHRSVRHSVRFDRVRKAGLYARHAVPEYWVIDVNKPALWLHREPQEGRYGSVTCLGKDELAIPNASELSGFSVRIAELM